MSHSNKKLNFYFKVIFFLKKAFSIKWWLRKTSDVVLFFKMVHNTAYDLLSSFTKSENAQIFPATCGSLSGGGIFWAGSFPSIYWSHVCAWVESCRLRWLENIDFTSVFLSSVLFWPSSLVGVQLLSP